MSDFETAGIVGHVEDLKLPAASCGVSERRLAQKSENTAAVQKMLFVGGH
jgi:hypothetical protein